MNTKNIAIISIVLVAVALIIYGATAKTTTTTTSNPTTSSQGGIGVIIPTILCTVFKIGCVPKPVPA